jgi:hypothetical protein
VVVSVGMSLVINTTFPFDRIASVYAGPKEIKSSGSSSNGSSKTGLLLGVAFSKRGSFNIVPHAPRRAEACAELDPAFHCLLGPCTEQWRFNAPTKKSNQRKTEGHQSALLGHHSFG